MTVLWYPDFVSRSINKYKKDVITNVDQVPTAWQTYLVFVAVMVFGTAIAIGLNAILNLLTSIMCKL
jgi:hypothetical protein